MLIGAIVAGAAALVAIAYGAGVRMGRRLFWAELQTDRRVGCWALEKLAEVHRAKLEIVELP